jgi:hypothetical protein
MVHVVELCAALAAVPTIIPRCYIGRELICWDCSTVGVQQCRPCCGEAVEADLWTRRGSADGQSLLATLQRGSLKSHLRRPIEIGGGGGGGGSSSRVTSGAESNPLDCCQPQLERRVGTTAACSACSACSVKPRENRAEKIMEGNTICTEQLLKNALLDAMGGKK